MKLLRWIGAFAVLFVGCIITHMLFSGIFDRGFLLDIDDIVAAVFITVLMSILCVPLLLMYSTEMIVTASEDISPSKHGVRYVVLATVLFLANLGWLIYSAVYVHRFSLSALFLLIFCARLAFVGIAHAHPDDFQ